MPYQRGDTTFSTNSQSSSIQINLHIPPPNQKTFDSNTGSATHKIIESRAKYLIKMTVALLPNVQFQQFHRSHVTHEVKFRHSLSKTTLNSSCKNLLVSKFPLKTAAAKTSWEKQSSYQLQHLFYVQQYVMDRSSHTDVFLRKGALKICSKFTGKHPCRSCRTTLLKSHFGMAILL